MNRHDISFIYCAEERNASDRTPDQTKVQPETEREEMQLTGK